MTSKITTSTKRPKPRKGEPGPWHVGDTGDEMNPCFAVYSSRGGCIADWIGVRASAVLIAEAPALLRECEKLADMLAELARESQKNPTFAARTLEIEASVRAVIARAKGVTNG